MTGTVTINGVTYNVGISDLTPADVLPVFRTDTSIQKTDSILLSSANSSVESPASSQNSAKKVLIPHLISLMTSAVAEDAALTIEPYYNDSGVYQGMYWHYNGQWLRRTDTGEMIRVDDSAAEIALAAEQAVEATIAAKAATTAATNTETRVSAAEEARVQAENQRKSNETQRQSHETARQNQEQSRQQVEQQRTATFQADHAAALAATSGAEQVNAELEGMTVTVTNREGTVKSVNIGFDIYRTYASVAAMNADAANVPAGKFVMIATSDATSEENARLYGKNSAGGFAFLSDLDQASSAAWADWLENMKPAISQRISTADADHTQAGQDHTRAEDMHAHPPYIADGTTAYPGDAGYFYSWDYTGQQYVRGPKLSLDFTSLTTAQYNQLVEDMKAYVTAPYGVFVGETLAFTGGAMHVGETLVVSERGEFSGEMLVLS